MNELLSQFHFLRPQWLLLILPTFIIVHYLRKLRLTQSGWQSLIAPHLYRFLQQGQAGQVKAPPFSLLLAGLLLSIVALAGPTWQKLPQPVYQTKLGHVLVLDMSMSMRATDITPNRLTRAKYKAIDIVNNIDEGETGVVAYAGDAFTISPLTSDVANITNLLPSLSPEIMPVAGSDALLGLRAAAQLLANSGYQQGQIYWLTDGIELDQVAELKTYLTSVPYTVNILAIGTLDGAPIQQLNGELLKRNNGSIVIPRLYPERLQSLAAATKGNFAMLSNDNRDIEQLIKQQYLVDPDSDKQETTFGDQWSETGPYLLLLCLPLFAYFFRRGLFFSLLLVCYLPLCSPVAEATQDSNTQTSSKETSLAWWQRPFMNADQQGLHEFQQQHYGTAATRFADPLWQGNAYFRDGDYQSAVDAFAQVNSAEGWYNQGNAYAKLGEYDAAIAAYEKALTQQPKFPDAEANKALLESLKQQQQNQQGDQQQNQQGDQQQGDDQQNANSGASEDNQGQQNQGGDDQQQGENRNDADNQSMTNKNDSSVDQSSQPTPEDSAAESNQSQVADSAKSSTQQSTESQQATQEEAQDSSSQQAPEQQVTQGSEADLTPEQREAQQRLNNLMKKIPDDPAFLLQRKMQLEAQKRQRTSTPPNDGGW